MSKMGHHKSGHGCVCRGPVEINREWDLIIKKLESLTLTDKQKWTRDRNREMARTYGITYCVLMTLFSLAAMTRVGDSLGVALGVGICAAGLTICLASYWVHRS